MLPHHLARAAAAPNRYNTVIAQALNATHRFPTIPLPRNLVLDAIVSHGITVADVIRALDSYPDPAQARAALNIVLYQWLGLTRGAIVTSPAPLKILAVMDARYHYTVVAFDRTKPSRLTRVWYPGITLADIRLAGGKSAAYYHRLVERGEVVLEPIPDA